MSKISQRSSSVVASPMRKFLPLLHQTETKGIKVYKLNIGDPDFLPPKKFYQELEKQSGKRLPYAPSSGVPEHIDAWRQFYRRWSVELNNKDIIITTGSSEAIIFSLLAITDPGDEVIVFEPTYTSYKSIAAALNIKLRAVTLNIKNDFRLPDDKMIEKQITKKTKAILVINPNNPTGSIISLAAQKRLVRLAKRRKLFILADETYREIIFDGRPMSFISHPAGKDSVIIIDSLSKRFSCPGARIGAVISRNPKVVETINKLAMMRLSAPTMEQYALIPCLIDPDSYLKKITSEYKKRRDLACQILKDVPQIKVSKPDGAFYLIAELPVKDSDDFVKYLITDFSYHRETVLITPAKDFYLSKGLGTSQVRIALVLPLKDLEKSLIILRMGLQAYLAKTL